LIQLQCEAS